jgi:molecular chaperone HtpG
MTEGDVETFAFQAEINQLLSLIINAFYSNKDIFLRELISNASDALDKIRYISLQNKEELENNSSLEIRITPDEKSNILIIEDTGIGMTKTELIENLGTIARSGTRKFMEALQDGKADLSLIGQFGVGFYSAYLVADKVRVVTKHNNDEQYVWESNAGGTFTITRSEEDGLVRGTRIYLHMKSEHVEYLKEDKLREIIKKHNTFINFPIFLQVEKEVEVQEETSENKDEDDGKVEQVDEKKETEKKKERVKEYEQLNTDKPLWTRKPADISGDEYKTFYKSFANDYTDPLAWKHFSVEGQLEFTGLMYIPEYPPSDIINRDGVRNMKLYVRRVFIMDDCKDLVPDYLSFIKGIIDSDDLPLNISREVLQQHKILKQIKKSITKKAIELFSDLETNEPDTFKKFYENFQKYFKLGVIEDKVNKDKLLKFLRFSSLKSGDDVVTLKQYIDKMPSEQSKIYYITGDNLQVIKQSPFLEKLRQKGFDVLFMVDPIDEYMMQHVTEYDGKSFICCTKDNSLTEESEEEKEQLKKLKEEYRDLCIKMKEIIGYDQLQRVQVTTRLTDTPCVIVTDQYGWTANMERIMKAQALNSQSPQMWAPMSARKVLEINPNHKFIQVIKEDLNNPEREKIAKDLVLMLFDAALLHSGFQVSNTNSFVKRLHRIISNGLVLDDEENEESDKEEVAKMEILVEEAEIDSPLEELD